MNEEFQLFTAQELRVFGNKYVKILVDEIKSAGKGGGKLERSVDYRLVPTVRGLTIELESEEYLKYVDQGRKPGTYPNITAISNWATLKGISQDAVFPIARKIFKFGIKPTNVISKTIRRLEMDPSITDKMEAALVRRIEYKLVQQIEKIN